MSELNRRARFEKERFEALHSLADFLRKVREERRALEWKLSLTLWIAMAVGMVAYRDRHIPDLALEVALIAVIVTHLIWVRANYVRNERDARRMYDHLHQAQAMFPPLNAHKNVPKCKWCVKWCKWLFKCSVWPRNTYPWLFDGVVVTSIFTTLLLAAFWFFIVNPSASNSNSTSTPQPSRASEPPSG
jgi:hypothetical protein